ncbi:MAG: nucleoside/nucleotide kinase family protein, partial [Frankia sp.]
PPGAGKSALARWLVEDLNRSAPGHVAYLPMDGFHRSDEELARLGLTRRKGAPPTFDAVGFVALLAGVAHEPAIEWWAPGFDRSREQTVPRAHRVSPAVRLVVTEGNYLLLDTPPWSGLRDLCMRIWFVPVSRTAARRRLLLRARAGGRDPVAARRWVESNDLVNGRLVDATAHRADAVVDTTAWRPPRGSRPPGPPEIGPVAPGPPGIGPVAPGPARHRRPGTVGPAP